ncbi:cytochrome P450 [Xylariomycetidae sp. FL2044]|nr:cytochrome P450 [Xylariomycetidae sp. FL2044]
MSAYNKSLIKQGLWALCETRIGSIIGLTITIVVFWVVRTYCYRFRRRRFLSPISHIPGPFLASISRLWHISRILKGDQNLALVEEHDKHGPFVRVAHNEVSMRHPEAPKALYLNSLAKGDWYGIFVFPDWRYPSAISVQDPKKKAEFMKYMSNAGFLQHNILRQEDVLDKSIRKLFGWIEKYASTGKSMDLSRFFTFVAYDIVGDVTFSQPFGFLDEGEDIGRAVATNVGLQIFLCCFGHYRWLSYLLNNPLMTRLQILPVGHIVNTSRSALQDRAKNPDASFDMAAHWFRGVEKAKQDRFDFNERHLLAAAVSNLGAGSDTVSCTLQTFVYFVHRQPDRWNRVRDEIEEAMAQGRCHGDVISFDDASRLPYLAACINECLRVMAPVPMGLQRVAPAGGVIIGGTTFPEGTVLSVNPSAMHLSKEAWGPDAREFRPERWLEPDIKSKEKYFMPFGLGWGSCPGHHLARTQVCKILATFVRDFSVELVDPKKGWVTPAYFTMNPHGWPVYVRKCNK